MAKIIKINDMNVELFKRLMEMSKICAYSPIFRSFDDKSCFSFIYNEC